jgi:hypothetical protein
MNLKSYVNMYWSDMAKGCMYHGTTAVDLKLINKLENHIFFM